MRKLFVLLLALAVLTACAPAAPEVVEREVAQTVVVEKDVVQTVVVEKEVVVTPEPEKVTLGFVYGAFTPQEKWEAYFTSFLEEHPNVEINYIPVPLDGWGSYTEKILTLIVGGEEVDVIWNAIEAVPLMAEKGVLLDLDPYMENDPDIEEFVDDVHPKLLEGLTWKDKQYLLPFAWNNVLMFYNIEMFAEAGLPEPGPDWTWDDFLEYATTVTTDEDGDGTNDAWGYASTYATWGAGPWTISNGSFWMNEDFSEPWYDKPETIEAMQFAYDLVWEYGVAPSGDFPTTEQFAAGNLAMFGAAPAKREGLIPAGVETDQYNINYWPTNTGEVIKGSIWGTDGYGIAAASENKDLSWELLKYLVSKEVMSNLIEGTNASGSAPARRSLATGPEFAAYSPSNYLYWYESLDAGRTVINSPDFATLGEIHSRYLSQAWAQEMTVEEAMTMIQQDMEAEIGE
jgi:multiple sugar transport system substrate-binding protein